MSTQDDIRKQIEACFEHESLLSEREREFLDDLFDREPWALTERQQEWLDDIQARVAQGYPAKPNYGGRYQKPSRR